MSAATTSSALGCCPVQALHSAVLLLDKGLVVHPVAMSVNTSICTKLPLAEGPLCATRSASTKPGVGSCQSAKVRTGTLRRTARGRSRPPSGSAASLRPHGAQGSVHRRRAHRQQTRADLGSELEMSVPLHRLNENGRQRFQALAADPVRCLPEHDQRFADRLIVEAPLRPWRRAALRLSTAEHAHGVLAMEPGHRDGGFMMNSQEVETAVRLGLDLVVLILDDSAYGMIRWKQAVDRFPQRVAQPASWKSPPPASIRRNSLRWSRSPLGSRSACSSSSA